MDPIKYIFKKPALTERIARWQMLLSEYDIQYVTQKAIKDDALVDFLAHQPFKHYQPMQPEFPDKKFWLSSKKIMRMMPGLYSLTGHPMLWDMV